MNLDQLTVWPHAQIHPVELIQITPYDRLKMFKVDVWHVSHRHCDGYPADGTGLADTPGEALHAALKDLHKTCQCPHLVR